MIRYLSIVFGMIAVAIGAAALSFTKAVPPLPDDPQNRGALRFADIDDPGKLDPGRTSASLDFRILKCLYQTLLVYEFGGEGLEPGVATDWNISDDKRVYTFNLREEAKWSDGEPVTAHDFVYAWRRTLLSETGADYSGLFHKIQGGKAFFYWRLGLLNFENLTNPDNYPKDELPAFLERFPDLENQSKTLSDQQKWDLTVEQFEKNVGIKALDDHILQVTLEVPTAFFLELCAFPTFSPVPEHIIEEHTELKTGGAYKTDDKYWGDPELVVTNGPYVLSEWKTKKRLVLDQNPEYWAKDQMGNLRIVLEVIKDPTLSLMMFEDGQFDWIPQVSLPELRAKLVDSEYEHAHIVPNAGTYYYQYNCREKLPNGETNPLADRRVRQALSMCIDRQAIVERVTRNNEPVSLTFVPAGQIPGYDSPVEAGIAYDPQAAEALLAEAGYPGGEGMPVIDLLVNATGTSGGTNVDIAVAIRKVWEDQLGLTVTISQPEFMVYLDESKKGNFVARRAGWFGDYRDPTTWLDMLASTDSNNDAKYLSPEYDALLAQAANETDPAARLEILRQAEALLLQDAPVCPLYNYATLMIYDAEKIDLGTNAWNNLRLDLVRIERD